VSKKYHCPKCNTEMETGSLVEGAHGSADAGRWQAGTPKKFFGSSLPATSLEIVTYRCPDCGLLESYAW
jgi:DNA-directed RNA polymerase subunit RPC12/RpoP